MWNFLRKKKLGKLNIKKELSKGQCDFCLDKYKEKILIKCYIITYYKDIKTNKISPWL